MSARIGSFAFALLAAASANACSRAPLPEAEATAAPRPSATPVPVARAGLDCAPTVYADTPGDAPPAPAKACPEGTILVPGSVFTMENADHGSLSMPAHRVVVKSFCLDRTEVTVEALNRCGPCVAATGPIPSASAARPVRGIDTATMQRYCAEQGKRLPSESEWELAARIGQAPPLVGCASAKAPCDVGASPNDRTPLGLVDLAGNVAELTSTEVCACESTNGSRVCRSGLVVRGGDHADSAKGTRTRTLRTPADGTAPRLGFRCAL